MVYGRSTFSAKHGIQKGKGLDLGVEPRRKNPCWIPSRACMETISDKGYG